MVIGIITREGKYANARGRGGTFHQMMPTEPCRRAPSGGGSSGGRLGHCER